MGLTDISDADILVRRYISIRYIARGLDRRAGKAMETEGADGEEHSSRLTEGRVVLGPGTLYGAIQNMTARGWIRIFSEETDSRKKKEYVITDLGRQVFAEEVQRLRELLRNAERMEEGEEDDKI